MFTDSDILNKKIFVLTAHPDDESFLAAGTIYANNHGSGQTLLVCATLGEKGKSHLAEPISDEELQIVRYKELQQAAKFLNVIEVQELGFPDGGVDQHEEELFNQTSELLEKFKPELIMSFGSDGVTGHRDHIAVSRVAEQLAKKYRLPLATFCLAPHILEDSYQWFMNKRKTVGHYTDNFVLQTGNLAVKIDKTAKLQTIKIYKSQIDNENPFANYPEYITEALLEEEWFLLKK